MPRPKKLTLDFFLHDANARGNRKIRSLRRKHGNDGYATYFVLLEMLCQENGLKLSVSDQFEAETIAEECGLRDTAHLQAVIQTCTVIGLLDKQLWEAERIVFSHGLYERYMARLEERQKMASRKAKSRAEKSYAERLAERIDEVRSQDPENRDLDNKEQRSDNRSHITDQSQQDNGVVTRDNPVTNECVSASNALLKGVSEPAAENQSASRQDSTGSTCNPKIDQKGCSSAGSVENWNIEATEWLCHQADWRESVTAFRDEMLQAVADAHKGCTFTVNGNGSRNDIAIAKHLQKLERTAREYYGQPETIDARANLLNLWAAAKQIRDKKTAAASVVVVDFSAEVSAAPVEDTRENQIARLRAQVLIPGMRGAAIAKARQAGIPLSEIGLEEVASA